MTEEQPNPAPTGAPSKEWWAWYLAPPENWRKKYGSAFEWTLQERMLMQQLEEKNTCTTKKHLLQLKNYKR